MSLKEAVEAFTDEFVKTGKCQVVGVGSTNNGLLALLIDDSELSTLPDIYNGFPVEHRVSGQPTAAGTATTE